MAKYRVNTRNDLPRVGEMLGLSREQVADMQAVSAVLPFKVNDYVLEQLIDRDDLPHDPIFQLTFPQRGMLANGDFNRMRDLVTRGASDAELRLAADEIRATLNPHPAGQMELNKPHFGGDTLKGMQHKYNETVLFFPTQGQTCHAYCTYCFRWAQFIGDADFKFASKEAGQLVQYVSDNPEISSVLITGGDPMVMKTKFLRNYISRCSPSRILTASASAPKRSRIGRTVLPMARPRMTFCGSSVTCARRANTLRSWRTAAIPWNFQPAQPRPPCGG